MKSSHIYWYSYFGLGQPDITRTIEADGGLLIASTPNQLRQLNVLEIALYNMLVQELGIKLED